MGNYLYKNGNKRVGKMEQKSKKRNELLFSFLVIIVIVVFDLIFLFNVPNQSIFEFKPILYLIFGYIFIGFIFLSYIFYLSKKLDLPIKEVRKKISWPLKILFIFWFFSLFILLLLFFVLK